MPSIKRRVFVATLLPWTLTALGCFALPARQSEDDKLIFGPAQPFDFDRLRGHAKALALRNYAPPRANPLVQSIDFDSAQKIKYRGDFALWRGAPGRLPIRLFHLGKYVAEPVKINLVDQGQAREILYSPRYFDYGGTGLDQRLPRDLGFAGFRVMDGPASETDWLAFQGASYFRTAGADRQYGASARAIAVNTALATAEEFPRFTDFWLEEAPDGSVTIHALLQGPSLTGAYRFRAWRHEGVIMDVHAEVFARADITRFGMAPLTSMYWYGENDRRHATDWRPEIHDSDGLALWTGKGERIWRPLINPPSIQTNSFLDKAPKGFGLMQRDRDFDHYQDDGAFYNRRPGVWVEPQGDWGEGAVQLVEIPTEDEVHDNVVAYWRPNQDVRSGDMRAFDYRLYWGDNEPRPPDLARVVATRIGDAGIPGTPPPPHKRKFVIDFEGGPLTPMAPRFDVTPVVTVSRGRVDNAYVIKVVGTTRWRALFDADTDGPGPLELRCFLRLGDNTLSETWLYQYFPPS